MRTEGVLVKSGKSGRFLLVLDSDIAVKYRIEPGQKVTQRPVGDRELLVCIWKQSSKVLHSLMTVKPYKNKIAIPIHAHFSRKIDKRRVEVEFIEDDDPSLQEVRVRLLVRF